MQAYLTTTKGNLYSWGAGTYHEIEGRLSNQPQSEEKMDTHNNKIGREIGNGIKKDFGSDWKNLSDKQQDNIIGVRIIERMQKGDLITHPDGRRTYKGNTVSSQKVKEYKGNELSNMVEKSNSEKFSDKIRQKYKSSINKYKDIFSKKTTKTAQNDVAGKWVTINGNHVLINS